LVLPPNPGRTLPAPPYTGAETSDTFGIFYWTASGNPNATPYPVSIPYTNSIVGLNRVSRTVDTAPNASGWDAPFFFEDRRNVFYVTTAEAWNLFVTHSSYGIAWNSFSIVAVNEIPPLAVNVPPPVPDPGPLVNGIPLGGGDPAALVRSVAQAGNIRIAVGSTTPVNYQGTIIYPTGQSTAQTRFNLKSTTGGSEPSN
jgi:hypothetical protein